MKSAVSILTHSNTLLANDEIKKNHLRNDPIAWDQMARAWSDQVGKRDKKREGERGGWFIVLNSRKFLFLISKVGVSIAALSQHSWWEEELLKDDEALTANKMWFH